MALSISVDLTLRSSPSIYGSGNLSFFSLKAARVKPLIFGSIAVTAVMLVKLMVELTTSMVSMDILFIMKEAYSELSRAKLK